MTHIGHCVPSRVLAEGPQDTRRDLGEEGRDEGGLGSGGIWGGELVYNRKTSQVCFESSKDCAYFRINQMDGSEEAAVPGVE